MKKGIKAVICLALVIGLTSSLFGCAKINYITNGTIGAINEVKSGDWKKTDEATPVAADSEEDKAVIDEFQAGTFGGVEFKTIDDVIKYYADAYNKTKAKKAMFENEKGEVVEMYAFADEKSMEVKDILVEGKANAVIDKLIPQLLSALYAPTIGGLHPCNAREPENDKDENGESLMTCRVTADDVVTANVKDNGDGTITITMQPKAVNMSRVGLDSQGKFYTTLNDIGEVVDQVDALSWASGTTEENCTVNYKGGTVTVKIDIKSGEIVEADYNMIAYVKVQHANIAVVKDKSLSATVDYRCHFPASKEFYDKVKCHPVN